MRRFRLYIIGIALLSTGMLYGRTSSFFELSIGGGWSSLGYRMTNEVQPSLSARQSGSYGLNAHFAYGVQFTRHIGVGIGVDLSRYGANAKLSGDAVWQGVTDTDGELYDHITHVSNWRDAQELYMVEIPLAVYLRFPIATDVRLYGQIGAKVCMPIGGKGKYSGMLSHSGWYEPWMMSIDNVPVHGFYNSTMEGKYDLPAKITAAAFVKIGVEAPVDELRHVWLFGAVYGTMHFMSAVPTDHSIALGWQNDTFDTKMQQAHYFMSFYQPVFYTGITKGGVKPLAVGAEIGIRFRIPHPKRYRSHCMCEEE